MLNVDNRRIQTGDALTLSMHVAKADLEHCIQSFAVQDIVRYIDQVHWSDETDETYETLDAFGRKPLENVAAHSWHVAEMCFFLARHFKAINRARSVELAMLHDKLELWTGDWDPVGPDGDGSGSHTFSTLARRKKEAAESKALTAYLKNMPADAAQLYGDAFMEMNQACEEASFVKAMDKLQALLFTLWKKNSVLSYEHLEFTLRYSFKGLQSFRGLSSHYALLHIHALREHGVQYKISLEKLFEKLREAEKIKQTMGLGIWLEDLHLLENQGVESPSFHVSSKNMARSK